MSTIGFALLNRSVFFFVCCNGSYWYAVNTVEPESVFTKGSSLSPLCHCQAAFSPLYSRFVKNTLLVWGRFSRVVVEVSKAEVCASPGAWQSPSSQSYQCCENPLKHSEAEITIFFLSFAVCGYHHPSHQKKNRPQVQQVLNLPTGIFHF